MYRTYPNTRLDAVDGSFSAEDVRRGIVALHTDYTCPFCGKVQSLASMGGFGGWCIACGRSGNPARAADEAKGPEGTP
jgi:hypothetical protein